MCAMYTAIQCEGSALPNFTDSMTVTARIGLFPYASTVSYTCLAAGQRFEDGNTVVDVTCAGIGLWDWNPIVTSCGCKYATARLKKLCLP